MRAKIYLETTILSYLAARPSRDLLIAAHQQMTRQWWYARRKEFDLFVSELVLEERSMGDKVVAGRRLDLAKEIPILGADNRIAWRAKFSMVVRSLRKLPPMPCISRLLLSMVANFC